jgi:hypothetical protein
MYEDYQESQLLVKNNKMLKLSKSVKQDVLGKLNDKKNIVSEML